MEKKFPIGHGPWMVAYLIAMIALLPSVLSLSLGTGVVAYAYATGGLYSQGGFSEAGTLLWNVAATALGWFLCSWLVLVWRLVPEPPQGSTLHLSLLPLDFRRRGAG